MLSKLYGSKTSNPQAPYRKLVELLLTFSDHSLVQTHEVSDRELVVQDNKKRIVNDCRTVHHPSVSVDPISLSPCFREVNSLVSSFKLPVPKTTSCHYHRRLKSPPCGHPCKPLPLFLQLLVHHLLKLSVLHPKNKVGIEVYSRILGDKPQGGLEHFFRGNPRKRVSRTSLRRIPIPRL